MDIFFKFLVVATVTATTGITAAQSSKPGREDKREGIPASRDVLVYTQNVRNFGALPNDAKEDTDAFQAALNAAANAGPVLFLP